MAGDLLIEQTPSATRTPITAAELELAIAAEVTAAPGCEAFVGVVIGSTSPKSRLDVNWELRGIKFGRADREIARQALYPIVERMQRQFRVTEWPIESPLRVTEWPIESPPGVARVSRHYVRLKGIATAAVVCLGVLSSLVLWHLWHLWFLFRL
jgi:hypothetical protein